MVRGTHQVWYAVGGEAVGEVDPFVAIRLENRVTARGAALRPEDDDSITALRQVSATDQRYHGPRGRLLTFNKTPR
jgi:hypothetical protein